MIKCAPMIAEAKFDSSILTVTGGGDKKKITNSNEAFQYRHLVLHSEKTSTTQSSKPAKLKEPPQNATLPAQTQPSIIQKSKPTKSNNI